ncbi:hypothetical protein Hypma_004385 [Hypsizygus marmoreus]|uniref:Uncharacterized protein n=1 Tax=Hypsizygus marmoreus TaxID=39966 RepID=A0A369JZL2_HYPMA|nr:hypothetical protein Hypma_004385 [Hypsizygus marmoreus]
MFNPFLPFYEVDPRFWPNALVHAVLDSPSSVLTTCEVVKAPSIPEPDEYVFSAYEDLIAARNTDAFQGADVLLSLVSASMSCLDEARKEMSLELDDANHFQWDLYLGDQRWKLKTLGGAAVDDIPIFAFTNADYRRRFRDGARPGLAYKGPPVQDDWALDPLDLALLVAMAQGQRDNGVEQEVYTVYLLYPNLACTDVIVLTGNIPSQSLDAIREGREDMPGKIDVALGTVPIVVNADPLRENGFLKMLAALIKYGESLAYASGDGEFVPMIRQV